MSDLKPVIIDLDRIVNQKYNLKLGTLLGMGAGVTVDLINIISSQPNPDLRFGEIIFAAVATGLALSFYEKKFDLKKGVNIAFAYGTSLIGYETITNYLF